MNVTQKDRTRNIIKILTQNKQITTSELQKLTNTSVSTLRRDLIALESTNTIQRNHGIVSLLENSNIEHPYDIRRQANEDAKNKICKAASKLIANNQAIFLDASSTLAFLPKYFSGKKNVHIITNSIHVALETNRLRDIDLTIIGGSISYNSDAVLGGKAIREIERTYRPDIAFMSCNSLNDRGMFMANEEQTLLKRSVIEASRETVLLVDHTKFRSGDYILMSDYNNRKITKIITDREPEGSVINALNRGGVELIIAK